jgi:hypothetical protein
LTHSPLEDVQLQVLGHAPPEDVHLQSRDLYIPAGDIGMWQGALRNPDDQTRADIVDAIEAGDRITVELLYSDQIGLQRTVSRFTLVPAGDIWLASLNRHWYLDWEGPRPEDLALSAAETIFRDRDAAAERRSAADQADTATEMSDTTDGGDDSTSGARGR